MLRYRLLAALSVLCLALPAQAQPGAVAPLTYRIGAPVADSAVAAILEHGGTRDTLTSGTFASSVLGVIMRNPGIDGDSAQVSEVVRSMVEGFVLETLVNATLDRTPDIAADTAAAAMQMATFQVQSGGAAAFDLSLIHI